MANYKTTNKKAKKSRLEPAMRITAARKKLIGKLADLLAEIAPATSRGKSSFCVKNLAEKRGHKKFWKDESNKRKSIGGYLESVFRTYPRAPKSLVLEIVRGGVPWKAKKGQAVSREHLDAIDSVLTQLGVNATRELKQIKLPEPSRVAPPPLDLVSLIERLDLHDALKDDCIEMFKNGHLNEAVRKALERLEKKIQDATGEGDIGKSLMAKAFKLGGLIPINGGTGPNDCSEQEGFMYLTMGAMSGMRNLYNHGDVKSMTPMDAFERICFVSFLFKRVDEALGS